MRHLSTLEKRILKRLVEWENHLGQQPADWQRITFDILLKVIAEEAPGRVTIDHNGLGGYEIEIATWDTSDSVALARSIQLRRNLIALVHFLDYLTFTGYIYTFRNDPFFGIVSLPRSFGENVSTDNYIDTIREPVFNEKVKQYLDSEIYPTQSIIEYHNAGYRTDEEVRHAATLKVSRISIWVAISLGLLGLLVTVVDAVRNPGVSSQATSTTIDSAQFRDIQTRLAHIDSCLVEALPKAGNVDTLLVKVVNAPAAQVRK
jgi:hypothetical protein